MTHPVRPEKLVALDAPNLLILAYSNLEGQGNLDNS